MVDPTAQSVLKVLPKLRLVALGRDVDISVPPTATQDAQIQLLVGSGRLRFRELLRRLGRDELKAACRAHGLDDSGRARAALAARLFGARGGAPETAPPIASFNSPETARYTPHPRDIVICRHRQWLVENVIAPRGEGEATQVRLVCLDDDNSGRVLEVLWELELGAKVHKPETHGLGDIDHIDPPRHFGAYLHALKWNAVSATDARLFQAPFRAGIAIKDYQLTPLKKALELPRANLFIADDVGLGKTIEAGLVLAELTLRQRVDLSLIACPAAVCMQWREEMQKRFGMHFEIMSREFVMKRRQERGFGVNSWATHNRFIISHSLLRRPEYRDPLIAHLGDRARKSLLILDEAHNAAPSAASRYAVDSDTTGVMRDLAPRFENRLFLSATPHNGHSNSFSALLEILDPQRFTRGVKVTGRAELAPVMVRRLKRDLRAVGEKFPERKVIQLGLAHVDGQWQLMERSWDAKNARYRDAAPRMIGAADPFELEIAADLARYTALARPERGRGKLIFITLQKRLLSSVEAFARTLEAHAKTLDKKREAQEAAVVELRRDDDALGVDDETLEALDESRAIAQTRLLEIPGAEAQRMLQKLRETVKRNHNRPDAKVLGLVDWIRRNQCASIRLGGADSTRPSGKRGEKAAPANADWSDRRLLVFTEYGDSKGYLVRLLSAAIGGTDGADSRIMQFHGGMSSDQRGEVERAFNGPPDRHPVRILIATDAAREGINLQAHCADLIHYDVPWNPARMEQRNGRIDRTLQQKDTVYCQYFAYRDRAEDPVIAKLVEKSETIAHELGSLGAVVMDDMTHELEQHGLDAATAARLDQIASPAGREASDNELESVRAQHRALVQEVEEAGEILNASRKLIEFDSALLRDALEVGFELSGAGKLTPVEPPDDHPDQVAYQLPELPSSWVGTLDALRPPRQRDEGFWDWRKRPLLPVTFDALETYGSETVHLHLSHPLVQRVLGHFLAQGFSAHDLSRVTVLRNKHDSLARVIAFGRLSLFGAGATRLHDELISVAAHWVEGKPLRPFAEEGDRNAIRMLEQIFAESPTLKGISETTLTRVRGLAPTLFAELWKPICADGDAHRVDATNKLIARGRSESDALKRIIETQRAAIQRRLGEQLSFDLTRSEGERDLQSHREQALQFERDKKYMERRLAAIDQELEREPRQIEALYQVQLPRLQPVGLVVLWPSTRS